VRCNNVCSEVSAKSIGFVLRVTAKPVKAAP
jgi:hypothetical protein